MRNPKDENIDDTLADPDYPVDSSLALIVASSPVTRIVVSRIAERAGLRTRSQTPEEVKTIFGSSLPALILLSGGADGTEVNHLLEQLADFRRRRSRLMAPLTVLLTSNNARHRHEDTVDAVIVKPVTPDRLQPVIRDLMDRLQSMKHE